MTAIGNVLAQAYAASQTAQAQSSQTNASQNSNNIFGDAVNVTLSPSGQAAANQNTTATSTTSATPTTNSNSNAPTHAPKTPAAHVSIVATSSTTSTATLVDEALQQVIPKVGVTGASEVVDNNGNIDQVKLQELLAQQDQSPQPAPTTNT